MVKGISDYILVAIWITIMPPQIRNLANMGVTSCLGGGLYSLSGLAICITSDNAFVLVCLV